MLTPQEIEEKVFVKAVFGGYDQESVDDFLETVHADYKVLYKESQTLKGKLKVLVEKVEEYRSTEDAMRMALLTAQRMGEEITVEATRMKDEMLQGAESEIKAKLGDTAKRIAEEEMRLAAASKETAKFLELSQAIMRKHAEFLKKLETAHRTVKPKRGSGQAPPAPPPTDATQAMPPPPAPPQSMPPPPAPTPTMPPPLAAMQDDDIASIAAQIGNAVESMTINDANMPPPATEAGPPTANAPDVAIPPIAASPPIAEGPPASLFEDEDESMKLYAINDGEDNTSPRPKFDFDDLKFGANFDNDE